jgi:6-phospho-beta-glucosidase
MATDRGLKIATIGGGSSYTPELIEGLIKLQDEMPVRDIYLVDIEEGREKLDIVGALAKRMIEKSGVDLRVHLTLDRREALIDADFVTTQFRVGQLEARIRDEKIPLKYGVIGQETTGPGGFAKAMRTIPVILDICRDMEELCPNAWLVNFTNPSGIITETVLKNTKIKAIGLCNGPIGMTYEVAETYNVPLKNVYIDFIGLNHLLWGQKILVNGRDVTGDFISRLSDKKEEPLKNIPSGNLSETFMKSLNMYFIGYLKYYYLTREMFARVKYDQETTGTRGEVVKKVEHELFELYRDPHLDTKPSQLAKRGGTHYSEAACFLMNSIFNNKGDIQVVNVMNNGAISDLPDDVVIERNCLIDSRGANPITAGHAPLKTRGLIQVVKAYEELTVRAGVTGSYDDALQALTIHPLVPSADIAQRLLDDIIEQNIDYLPQFARK